MSSHHKGEGRQKRAHSPEAGQSSRRRPAPSASHDQQVAQVTQGFGNIGLTTASRGQIQYYGLPQPPMPTITPHDPQAARVTQSFQNPGVMPSSYGPFQYSNFPQPPMSTFRSAPQIAAGQLSADDDKVLRTAVASGASYQDIKDIMFRHRLDLSPQILQRRAFYIRAEWSPNEDEALLTSLEMEVPWKPDDDGYLARLHTRIQEQGEVSPSRSTEDIKERTKNLMNISEVFSSTYPPTQGPSQGQQGHAYGTQADILASTAANPNHQAPGYSSYQAKTISQRRASPSSRPVQHYDVSGTVHEPFQHNDLQLPNPEIIAPTEGLDLVDFKGKLAEGITFTEISEMSKPRRSPAAIREVMEKGGWQEWSQDQDNHLLQLSRGYGNSWPDIRILLTGPKRDEDEIQKRVRFLTETRGNSRRNRYAFTAQDDDYLRSEGAKGTAYRTMTAERFSATHLSIASVGRHARTIGATWSEEDDQILRAKVLEYENHRLEVDWGSIGEQWLPSRRDWAVALRWERLRGLLTPEG